MKTKTKAAPKQAAAAAIRPGLVIYDSSWTGPSIVIGVDDECQQVTILTSLGVQTTDRGSLLADPDGIPGPGSALDLLADGIAQAVKATPGLLPGLIAAEPVKAALAAAMDAIGRAEAAICHAQGIPALDPDWEDDLNAVWSKLMEAYRLMGQIVTDASATGDDAAPARDMQAGRILAGIRSFARPAQDNTSGEPVKATDALDARTFHRLAVQIEELALNAMEPIQPAPGAEQGENAGATLALAIDGQPVPDDWRMDENDARNLRFALKDVRLAAESIISHSFTSLARKAVEGGGK